MATLKLHRTSRFVSSPSDSPSVSPSNSPSYSPNISNSLDHFSLSNTSLAIMKGQRLLVYESTPTSEFIDHSQTLEVMNQRKRAQKNINGKQIEFFKIYGQLGSLGLSQYKDQMGK